MCGVCGFWSAGGLVSEAVLSETAHRMADTLRHRGPDDSGIWTDAAAGIALGHRRLSIQDVSPAGRQPMVSPCGRFIVIYNGEIYNFRELRNELEGHGHTFRGRSDTEVLVTAFTRWGIEGALRRANGMFAFAVWDRRDRTLTLARDRVGKKPLYYGWSGGTFLFGSELAALRAHPDFNPRIDPDALGLFIQYSAIPTPYSIYTHVRKLPPASLLTVTSGTMSIDAVPQAYWSARDIAERGSRMPYAGSFDEATDELEELLKDTVRQRMIADVPLGALLSGGIDSTTVVALMQSMSVRPVKTFSIGFHETSYDEAPPARAIAGHLATDHTELYVTPGDCMEVVPTLPVLYDEPFGDSSQIPTFIVSRLARTEVTVALTGDGGDELFAGYRNYYGHLKHWGKWGHWPLFLRRGWAAATGAIAPLGWHLARQARPGVRRFLKKMEERSQALPAADPVDLAARKRARAKTADEIVIGAEQALTALTDPPRRAKVREPLQGMMYLDFVGYLPDDILVKIDRASMAVSLEVRSPFLDQRMVEFAWSLPLPMRVGPDGGKRILRRVLARYVPSELTDRPKAGFAVPVAEWVRGPLRDWAESLLDPTRLKEEGFLRPAAVRRVWDQHLSGWRDHRDLIWSVLMFQAWHDMWLKRHSVVSPLRATA